MMNLVRIRILQVLAFFAAIVSLCLFAMPTDVERFLKQNAPGQPMPDAFNELNNVIPVFMLFVTATMLLSLWIERKVQPALWIPLVFGPSACFAGWGVTENFDDPNWFHLFALTTIGMLVSCAVTAVLLIATKKTTEQNDARQALDRAF
jgi:hypothetical protein